MLGGKLPDGGGEAGAAVASSCPNLFGRRGRSHRGRAAERGGFRLRLRRLGGRRGRGGSCSGHLDLGDHRSHENGLSLGGGDLDQLALEGRRDLGIDLVRDHLDDRLVTLDEVALVFQPVVDCALGDRFTELRHLDLGQAHAG